MLTENRRIVLAMLNDAYHQEVAAGEDGWVELVDAGLDTIKEIELAVRDGQVESGNKNWRRITSSGRIALERI